MVAKASDVFKRLITKPGYYFFTIALIAFFWVAFDKNFAGLFTMFVLASLAYHLMPRGTIWKRNIDINTVSGNTSKAFGVGLMALVAFLAVSFFTVQLLQGSAFTGFQSVLDRISQTTLGATGTPLLSGNPLTITIVGALLIPIVETEFFFVTLPQFLGSVFSIPLSLTSVDSWLLMLAIAGIFTYYHIEAKSVTDNVAYILTFVFGIFQGWLVLKFREGESAIHMHIQNNALGMLQRFVLKPLGV